MRRRGGRRSSVGVFALLAGVLASALAFPWDVVVSASPAGLYVWGEADSMTNGVPDRGVADAAEQDRLLRLCLGGPLPVRRIHFLADPRSLDRGSLERFLQKATESGIEVFAVAPGGLQDDWVRPVRRSGKANPEPILAWARNVVALGRPGARFAGLQLDVEPHRARARTFLLFRSPVWEENGAGLSGSSRNRAIAWEYLSLLEAVRLELARAKPRPALAVTMPTWIDGGDYVLERPPGRATWASLVQARADFVTLMDYVGESGETGAARAVEAIASEIASGPVEILLETASPGAFGGAPRREETLYGEGEAGLLDLAGRIEDLLAGRPNFVGCAVHHYRHAYGSGRPGWPTHDDTGRTRPGGSFVEGGPHAGAE